MVTPVEAVYIQRRPDGEFVTEAAYVMWDGCRLLGIETRPFCVNDLPSLPLTRETAVHGYIGPVRKALDRLGVTQPPMMSAPAELLPFFGRKVYETTMRNVRAILRPDERWFIKPLHAHKLFDGHVVSGNVRDLIRTASCPDDTAILASEVVRFVSEYRLFVHRGEIVGCRHYSGDFASPIDFAVARAAVEAFRSAPVGYSLDMGRADDGRTLVVEVNDAFALGSYGLPSVKYATLVLDRWAEIVGLI